ncbi:MAG: SLC13 family permease [Kiritimatiellia bacterium]|jgi:Na+/H+ antiporter NhaD/arsenite permease-like protein|nr:SLC13 family permease [Kiritimatiellia bacterium]MDD4172637.1 SLC13 family permease [Kiritimatiellia bacterium]MDD4440538.1 SLC13 family permease [Kiritimatiellia bacterium]MDX9793329.1 SLC13 family permease [Kiritimatiellia bacterium]
MYSEPVVIIPPLRAVAKIGVMAAITALVGWGSHRLGLAPTSLSMVAVCTFIAVICTTLFFWTHRVAVAFIGVAVLIGSRAMTLHGMLRATELDIIFFLIGMMVIVGALKDLGFLTWVIQAIINKKRMNGMTFTVILCSLSALLSSVVDEVSSIVVVLALVFQVCDTLKVRSSPFVLMAVLCTNIGSAATMLGNPVGIFIGNKAGFNFSQFLSGATPISFVSLLVTLGIVLIWYRKTIHQMTLVMEEHRQVHHGLGPLIRIPYRRGLFVLVATVLIIAFHHQIENILGLTGVENKNAFLIITPLVIAGLLMIYRPGRARHYIEHDVEWWTLLFFMLLFAIAGGLEEQGITQNLADKLTGLVKGGPTAMVPFVLAISAVGSAFVDNIVFVAAFTPVIQALVERSAEFSLLWWALLFGACFGGNITAVGSTANIVALGLLEKRGHLHIAFFEWLKIGAVVGIVTCVIAWLMLTFMPMPHPAGHPVVEREVIGPLHEPHLSPKTAQ